jgi:L-ascorbate 6-phosphate lactonase
LPELIREIEDASLPPGSIACWGLGGMGVAIKGSDLLLYIDLFLNPQYQDEWVSRAIPAPFADRDLTRANVVLATHEHPDHCDPVALGALAGQTSAVFAGPHLSCGIARKAGFPEDRIMVLSDGSNVRIGKVSISALHSGDLLAKAPLVYVIEFEGFRILHAGDSLLTDSFDVIGHRGGVDVAFLATSQNPAGENWYLQPSDLIEAAHRVGCQVLVPGHWDLWRELAWPPEALLKSLHAEATSRPIVLLPVGRHLLLSRGGPNADLSWSVAGSIS